MPPITIELDDETIGRIDAICTEFDLTTTQLISRAIRRLSALIEERQRQIGPTPGGVPLQSEMPWLSRWQRRG